MRTLGWALVAVLLLAGCLSVEGEHNGWGTWADGWAGRGDLEEAHPVQSWLHGMMRAVGSEVSPQSGGAGAGSGAGRGRMLAGNTTADGGGGDDEGEGMQKVSWGDKIKFSEQDFNDAVSAYIEEHEGEVKSTVAAIIWGGFFIAVATGLFLYGEIRLVMVTRESDALTVADKSETEDFAKRKERRWTERLWLMGAGAALMFISLLVILLKVCALISDLLSTMRFEFEGCFSLVVVGSVAFTLIWGMFLAGLCWCCTRPYTAGVLLVLALLGDCAIDTEEEPSVFVWLVFSALVGYVWFTWGGQLVDEKPKRDPEQATLLP